MTEICLLILGLFNTIFGAAAATLLNTDTVESSADDVIAHTREVLHTTPTNKDDTVLLQVVPLVWDVGNHFDAIGQADLGNLTDRRVGLLGRTGHDLNADPAAKRVAIQSAGLGFFLLHDTRCADKLVDCRH